MTQNESNGRHQNLSGSAAGPPLVRRRAGSPPLAPKTSGMRKPTRRKRGAVLSDAPRWPATYLQ